jgi:hypothetical protein
MKPGRRALPWALARTSSPTVWSASLMAALSAVLLALTGCTTVAKPTDNVVPVAEVTTDVRTGAARSFDDCTWYPGAAGFSRPPDAAVRPLGQLVLREESLLWGQYDMAQSLFRVARRIPFKQIKTVSLAQKAGRNMLVLESVDGGLDSFAIEHPSSEKGRANEPDPAATAEAWRFLRTLLGL